jgi:hypothetical protein
VHGAFKVSVLLTAAQKLSPRGESTIRFIVSPTPARSETNETNETNRDLAQRTLTALPVSRKRRTCYLHFRRRRDTKMMPLATFIP